MNSIKHAWALIVLCYCCNNIAFAKHDNISENQLVLTKVFKVSPVLNTFYENEIGYKEELDVGLQFDTNLLTAVGMEILSEVIIEGDKSMLLKKYSNVFGTANSADASISIVPIDTLVITEIMYNPPESGQDSSEFIEIYNPMNKSLNLAGYYFSQGVSHTFGNIVIPSKGYIVICGDSLSIFNNYGFSAYDWTTGVLSNGGEDIVLKDPNGRTIDSVNYDDTSPWPTGAQGVGPSIVLCNVSSDNNLGVNWTESTSLAGKTINGYTLKGSPGGPDVACGVCSNPDSTFAISTSCDSVLTGSVSTLFSGVGGCDSVHTITTVYDTGYSIILSPVVVCFGDSALIFGVWRDSEGIYYDSLQTQLGCDSIFSQELIVDSIIYTSAFKTICYGDSALIFAGWESIQGVYSDTSASLRGCDSIHTVTLTVLPISIGSTILEICDGDSALVGGTYFETPGSYIDTLLGANGCDSVVTVILSINSLDTTYKSYTTGNPQQAGVFDTTYTNVNGCDSTVVTTVNYVPVNLNTLVITEIMYNPPESGTDINEYIEIHNLGVLPVNLIGFSLTNAVNYTFGNVSIPSNGYVVVCKDSIAIYSQFGVSAYEWSGALANTGELILLKDSVGNTLDSVQYSSSGLWPSGADGSGPSIVLCDWTSDNSQGINWIESSTSTGNIINGSVLKGSPGTSDWACGGCLSTDSTFIAMVTCDSNQAGISTLNLINSQGCDSVVTTVVSFDPGNVKLIGDIEICEGDSILIFSEYQNLEGSYFDTLSNVNGCDSVIVANLIVIPAAVSGVKDSICSGYGLFVGGSYQTTAGIYYDTLATGDGCDSVVITELSIRTDSGCGPSQAGDSLVIVTEAGWMKSTVVNLAEAGGYPWAGVSSLPPLSTFTIPAEIGQPKPYHSIDSVEGAKVFKSGNGVTFFRTTFNLSVDTGVSARFRSFMDDGIEIYINGFMIAREDDRHNSNLSGQQHHLVIKQNGERESGAGGDQEFDVVNNYRMDSVVHTGTNDLIIALRNAPQSWDNGGVSFRMDIKTGEPYMPVLTGYIVSDAEWQRSTIVTPGGSSWNWSGLNSLPAANTYTEEVDLGQPYGWYSTEEVDASYAIKAGENVTYYRRRFSLVDSSGINVQLRTTFDENLMVFVNDSLIAGNFQHGLGNRALPAHDALYPNGGVTINGNAGGDGFMQVENVNFDQILRKGDNYITVALQNRANDKGGFSLRLDMDKSGSPVIRKNTPKEGSHKKTMVALGLDFEVYPNPTTGVVYINLIESPSSNNEVIVSDVNGKILLQRSLVNPQTGLMDLDISSLPRGMYIVRIRSGEIFKGKPLLRF